MRGAIRTRSDGKVRDVAKHESEPPGVPVSRNHYPREELATSRPERDRWPDEPRERDERTDRP